MLRIVLKILLSTLLVPILWALTQFVTPGVLLVHAESLSRIGRHGSSLRTAAAVDFAAWLSLVCGVSGLRTQLQGEMEKQGEARRWPSPLRDPAALFSALACALPLSFYGVLGAAWLLKRGWLLESTSSYAGAIGPSLAACTATVYGLYALALRFLPKPKQAANLSILGGNNEA